jgi:hypothetical protein
VVKAPDGAARGARPVLSYNGPGDHEGKEQVRECNPAALPYIAPLSVAPGRLSATFPWKLRRCDPQGRHGGHSPHHGDSRRRARECAA